MPFTRMPSSSIQVVDSHTAGEPTRVVVAGGPELGNDPLAGRLRRFAAEHDDFRSAVVNEPRGSDVIGRRATLRAGGQQLRNRE